MNERQSLPKNYLQAESYAIRGAFYEVYNILGCGFLENIYQEALELELQQRHIPFVAQQVLQVTYKGQRLKQTYRPDVICYNSIIVELKAQTTLTNENEAQLHNYLKVTGIRLGFLVNFGHYPGLEIRRIVR